MNADKGRTLTLKIIDDRNELDLLHQVKSLTEAQKELIRYVVKTTLDEYVPRQNPPTRDLSERMIRLPEVMDLVGLSRSTIYEYIKIGKFPKPIPLGTRCVAWLKSEIIYWIFTTR